MFFNGAIDQRRSRIDSSQSKLPNAAINAAT
jgi:hypothetical protein